MALNPPSGLAATAISSVRIDLSWAGGGKYNSIHIERKLASNGGWVQIDVVDGTEEYYIDESPPLTPETEYDYKIRGRILYPEMEYSDYTGVKSATTFATLAPPSLCVATAFSDFIEITWKDNSEREDDFRLWRKVGVGEWAEYQTIPANMDYYRDEAVAAGTLYTYRVLAKDGAESSDPSNEDSATAQSAPAAPTVLVKSDVQDRSIQLSWTDNATNETGFKIEIGIDVGFGAGKVDRVVGADVTAFLATGLNPSTQYWFRVRAYNGVGNSGYSNVVTDTTLAAGVYTPTEFEKWIRNPNIEPVYLAEVYTKMDLTGFTLESGVVWKKTIGASDRGIDILEVFEESTSYVEKTSIATVQATAQTFWFDYDNRILYIHTTGGANPNTFDLIEGAFWLYFSTHKDIEFTANGRLNHFLPLLTKEDIPDITQEIKSYFEGSFAISSGSVAFMNAKIMGEHFFDKKFGAYTWINAKVILKAGSNASPVFTYAQFKEIFTAYINEKSCSDKKITFQLRDVREEMTNKIALNTFDLATYPTVEEKFIDKPRPLYFGTQGLITPVCIDEINEKFQCNDGRIKSVDFVYKNGLLLVKDKHYYVDYQRGRITFDRDGAFTITPEINDKINFKEGAGGQLTATLDSDTYTATELCAEIKAEMESVGGQSYTVSMDADTKKFTIAVGAGLFKLLWKSGTNGMDGTRTHVGTTIGYAEDEDCEGAASYEADADVISIHKQDIIGVQFTGLVNSADEVIQNGAEVFKYLMNTYKSLTDTELNLDSIYEAKYTNENEISVPIEKEASFDEIVRTIEHSIEAYTFQDEFGRLGIRPQQTIIASKAKYIISKHIFDHLQKKDRSSLFWKVVVYYNKDYNDNWESKEATDNNIYWRFKITEELPIHTYLRDPVYAQALATSILSLLNKEQIEDELPMMLFDVMPGDLIKFSRVRFYDSDGTASEITLRVVWISKNLAAGGTSIKMEAV